MSQKKEEKTISPKNKIEFVKWFSELNKNSGNIAGGKGANLAEMFNIGMPVPPGFAITAQAYDYFIEKAGIKEKINEILDKIDYEDTKQLEENTKEIRNLITSSKIPAEMQEEILEAYDTLNVGKLSITGQETALAILKKASEPLFVAVRSSATTEDLATASFAGQQETFLNIKGNSELLNAIKACFASLFTARATYYRNKTGFSHEKFSLSVIVQKMIDSDKSGVIFSKDPSFKNENIIIEAVFGLGEGIVSGQINPDKYVISNNLQITDQKISNKKIAITRDSSGKKDVVRLNHEKANSQVLTKYEIKKLAEYALRLEEHYKKPQDIEFAIEGVEIYIVQTRPITTLEKRTELDSVKQITGEIILNGIAASSGIASGKVKIIENLNELEKINKGDILVTEMTNPDMVVTMQKSAAIVTNEGGLTSHAAIVSREMGIPCVVGTDNATTKLKEGEIITVDGFTGKVYKGKISESVEKDILPVVATKTKIKAMVDLPSFAKRASKTQIKEVGLTRIEGIIAESGKHPNYFLKENKIEDYEEIIFEGIKKIAEYFDKLWIRTSDIRSDEFSNLEGAQKEIEANPMLGMHGIRFGLKHKEILKAELKALKRVSQQRKKIGVLLPQVISVEEVKEVKKILREINFLEVEVGVMVETPAAVEIIKELCEEGISFISFGTNDLTQFTLAIDRGNTEVQYIYDEMNPAILNQIKRVIGVCKSYGVETSICGQAGSKKEMVKFLVEQGIDSISVNADVAYEISKYVAELEEEKSINHHQEPAELTEGIENQQEESINDTGNSLNNEEENNSSVKQDDITNNEEDIDNKPEDETISDKSSIVNESEVDEDLTDNLQDESSIINEQSDEKELIEQEMQYNNQEKQKLQETESEKETNEVLDIF